MSNQDRRARELDANTFMNPAYAPPNVCRAFLRDHPVSNLAHMASGLVTCAKHALENETSSTPIDQRGIDTTLALVEGLLGDVIEEAEQMEKGRSAR